MEAAIRTLVAQMATANPLWGAARIPRKLGKLGIEVYLAPFRRARADR
jgi:hypothetical protein